MDLGVNFWEGWGGGGVRGLDGFEDGVEEVVVVV